jgi:AcrR family transcriptional regulator
MPTTPIPRPPQQKRSRKTLTRIVEAGTAILREKGPEALTVQDVVARARTSVGSFYQRFSGKEELLRHLEGALANEERARFDDALAAHAAPDLPLADKVATVVALLVSEASAAKPAHEARVEAVIRALASSPREIRHPDPEAAIRIGYAAVSGALREAPPGIGVEQLASELARLWLSYLGASDAAGPKAGAVDFFEVWG